MIKILKDSYAYSDLEELSKILNVTVKAIIRKAQKIKLHRAKNNQVVDNYKFCSLCQIEHPTSEFYRNKAKFDNYEYHCKRYYNFKKLKKEKQINALSTPPLTQKRAFTTERYTSLTEYVKNRPRNPVIIVSGIEGKICNSCKTFKPADEFSKCNRSTGGYKATCKQCYKERYSKKSIG